jgi:outer membrane protein TolC
MRISKKGRIERFARSRKLIVSVFIASLMAGIVQTLQAQERTLSIAEAAQAALEKNPDVQSANWDWLAATAKASAASFRLFPSLSLSASYQRLSELPPMSISFSIPPAGPISLELPPSLTNAIAFGVNLQYPVFAGYRLREALSIARLTADGKLSSLEIVKRTLIFEVRHSYWEALRADNNVRILKRNLELMTSNYKLLSEQVASGAAIQADLLAVDTRRKQAEIDLGSAVVLKQRAYLLLASQIGWDVADLAVSANPSDTPMPFVLSTPPEETVFAGIAGELDEKQLIGMALARRPETRASALAAQAAEHSARLAASALYPTVAITGNYALADPNPRVAFQTDPWKFTGTWSVGVQMSYDIGGVPATVEETKAQELGVSKTRADALKLRNTVVLDVRTCILTLTRARADLELIKEMVAQAEENVRVAQKRYEAGTLNEVSRLSEELALLRAQFAVANKQIDVQIAAADLLRATAMEDLP